MRDNSELDTMTDILALLGLDETADLRTIRRAYARQLKGIDQAADPAGFQRLREAYEAALAWADDAARLVHAVEGEGQPPANTAVTASAASTLPDEARLADVVWDRFEAGRQALAQAQRLADPDAWHELLLERLRDDELVNIEARLQFEWRIVHLLGKGWRPGHEALFPAAVAAFDWANDRRLLARFDYLGDLLNAAIDERALFDSQAIAVRSVQERIAMLLRRAHQADPREIVQSMAELCKMEAYFPALLTVVTNADNVAYWHAHFPASQEVEEQRIDKRNEGWNDLFLLIVVAIAAFFIYHSHIARKGEPAEANSAELASDPRANPPSQAQLENKLANEQVLRPPQQARQV